MRQTLIQAGLALTLTLVAFDPAVSLAQEEPEELFDRTWARTDQPVAELVVSRTWMWGPEPFTDVVTEPYADAPGGERAVLYHDKSRMENNSYRGEWPWDVTNGLLVVELITGRVQLGDNQWEEHQPANVNVAGDPDDPDSPTYASFTGLLDPVEDRGNSPVTERVDRSGTVTDDPMLDGQGVALGFYDNVTRHNIADRFWEFMNSTGTVHEDGAYIEASLFENPFFATGRPITEPYWADVSVAGIQQLVLTQCFERRCLTYTPGNPEGWQIEAGNVGQHYYEWRFGGSDGGDEPFSYELDDSITLPDDELPGLDGGPPRSVGAMVDADGNQDDFALNEVTMAFRDQAELDAFLERYNGTVLRTGASMPVEGLTPPDYEPESNGLYLIRIDPQRSSLDDLEANMTDAGFGGEFTFSSEDAARLIAILARERSLPIGPNVVLRGDAIPEHPQSGGGNLDAETWPWMTEDDDPNTAGDQGLSVGVTRAWDYLAYKDVPPSFGSEGGSAEWSPSFVAVIDGGFALDEETGVPLNDNQDFFYYGDKPIQADMVDWDNSAGGRNRTSCSGGSDCPWHGQGAFGVMGATPRNQYGSAGSGGPVVVPILMKVDWTWYGAVQGMYTLGDAIRASQFFGSGRNRADVVSVSISGGCFTACGITEAGGMEDFHDYMQRAVETATTFGATVVASAGNRGLDLDSSGMETGWSATIPCELNHVICVGAIDDNKQAKDYSNWGSDVDIWAPTDLLSTTNPDTLADDANDTCDSALNTSCDELKTFGGTSAATPFVAGIHALMTALDKNADGDSPIPSAGTGRVEAIQQILQDTANSSPDTKVPTGYVDAYRAVAEIRGNRAPTIAVLQPESGASTSWKSSSSYFHLEVNDPEPGAHLPIFLGETEVVLSSDRDGQLCSVVSSYLEQTLYLCDRPEMSLGEHQVTATVTDPFGATGSTSFTLNVINETPSAEITTPATGSTFFADQVIQFRGSGFDLDEDISDDQLSWTSSIDGDLGTGTQLNESLSQGQHTITLTVTDSHGATGQDSVDVTIQAGAGHPSALILQPASNTFIGPSETLVLEGEGVDPEDGELSGSSLSWSSDVDGFLGTGTSLEVTLSGPADPCEGRVTHVVTLEVTDSDGNQASQSIEVTVGRIC